MFGAETSMSLLRWRGVAARQHVPAGVESPTTSEPGVSFDVHDVFLAFLKSNKVCKMNSKASK